MQPRIVILGAGFVGLTAARRLRRLLPQAEILVVNQMDHFLFTPRLIDALAGVEDVRHQMASLDALAKRNGFRWVRGHAQNIDRNKRFVEIVVDGKHLNESYDYLVIAVGSEPNFYGVPGAEEHTVALKTFEHVHLIHDQVTAILREAEQHPAERDRLLSFIVVGGGASGIESLFALRMYLEHRLTESHPDWLPLVRFTLLQGAPQILVGFPRQIVDGTRRIMKESNVRLIEGDPVTAVDANGLTTAKGIRIEGRFKLWGGGIQPNRMVCLPILATDKAGCLATDRELRCDEHMFAAGDCIVYSEKNVTIPKNAQTAMKMGLLIAENIAASVCGRPLKQFHYRNLGNIITLMDTGFIDLRFAVIRTSLAPWLRDVFYDVRFRQVTGM